MIPKKKFEGLLATPIEPRRFEPGMLCPDDEREARSQQLKDDAAIEDLLKLYVLCDHYGIKLGPHRYLHLSLTMARQFVPGFREKAQRGRKTKWTIIQIAALIVAMEKKIEPGTSRGVTWAAKALAKKAPWKSFLEEKVSGETDPNPAESLRKKYHDSKGGAIAEMARRAFKPNADSGEDREVYDNLRDAVNKFLTN